MPSKKSPSATAASFPPQQELMGRELSNAVVFFHEAIASHLGISAAEWKCLGLLDQHGPLTASHLAELSGFTTGAITGIVDRLEHAGYAPEQKATTIRRS
jgi:DNA-binding MarR family transcriptional regulator